MRKFVMDYRVCDTCDFKIEFELRDHSRCISQYVFLTISNTNGFLSWISRNFKKTLFFSFLPLFAWRKKTRCTRSDFPFCVLIEDYVFWPKPWEKILSIHSQELLPRCPVNIGFEGLPSRDFSKLEYVTVFFKGLRRDIIITSRAIL